MNIFGLRKTWLLAVIAIISCVFAVLPVHAMQNKGKSSGESTLDKILNSGVVRVGTTADYLPYSYHLKDGSLAGVDILLAKELGRALGVEVKFVETTWSNLMPDLLANKYDIAMSGITIKLSRQKKAFFSIPVETSGKAAITRDENVDKYRTVADINKPGVRVIVNPGGTNEAFARKNFPNATIIRNKDNHTVFRRVANGDVDLMVTDAIETLVQEKIYPELASVNADKPFNFFQLGYMMNRDYTWKAFVDQWVNVILHDGTYRSIREQVLQNIADNKDELRK